MMKTARAAFTGICVLVALFATSCGGGDGTPGEPSATIVSVAINPTTITLDVGGTQQLQATVKDSKGTTVANPSIEWTTSHATVASVSASGVVTAIAVGAPVTISATVGGIKGNASVIVSAPVASIAIEWDGKPMEFGKPQLFKAVLRDASGATLPARPIGWSSSDPTVVVVSANGTVSPVGRNGSASITAAAGGKSASVDVTTWWQYGPAQPGTYTTRSILVAEDGITRSIAFRARIPEGQTASLPLVIIVPIPHPDAYGVRNFWEEQLAAAGYATFLIGTAPIDNSILCVRLGVPENECGSLLHPTRLAAAFDVKVILDKLSEIEGRLGVTFNRSAIGVTGWSAGGAVAMYLSGARIQVSPTVTNVSLAEPRIKAFLGNSPPAESTLQGVPSGFTNDSWNGLTVPMMIQTGAGDAPGRRASFDNMPATGNKYLAWFGTTAIGHVDFALDIVPPKFMVNNALAFFGAHLYQEADARLWLTSNQLGRATSGESSISAK